MNRDSDPRLPSLHEQAKDLEEMVVGLQRINRGARWATFILLVLGIATPVLYSQWNRARDRKSREHFTQRINQLREENERREQKYVEHLKRDHQEAMDRLAEMSKQMEAETQEVIMASRKEWDDLLEQADLLNQRVRELPEKMDAAIRNLEEEMDARFREFEKRMDEHLKKKALPPVIVEPMQYDKKG